MLPLRRSRAGVHHKVAILTLCGLLSRRWKSGRSDVEVDIAFRVAESSRLSGTIILCAFPTRRLK